MNVDLHPEIAERLAAAAAATGRSSTELISEAVLNLIEDIEDVAAAEAALEELEAGRSGTTSLDDVVRELGLADRIR